MGILILSVLTIIRVHSNPVGEPNSVIQGADPVGNSRMAQTVVPVISQTPPGSILSSAEAWNRALQYRRTEEFFAPTVLRYVQYQLDESGAEKSRENGIWILSYDEKGSVDIQVKSATKDGKDFTEERKRRLQRGRANTTRMMDILSPFDELAQGVLKREQGELKELKGVPVWEYPFELPKDERTLVGTAWVSAREGKPIGFRYAVRPLPLFVDRIEVRVTFDQDQNPGRFEEIEYSFAASFLIFTWIGGGVAWPEEWAPLSVKPRFSN